MPSSEQPTSRRERKKQQTRTALARAALDLFLERGIDNVTVSDITAVVDVDRSTFFRYFGSKEAVLFTDRDVVLGSLNRLISERPVEESLQTAVVNAYAELIDMIELDPALERMRLRLAAESATVRSHMLSFTEDVRLEIRAGIANRLGLDPESDPRPDVISGAVIAAVAWTRVPSLRRRAVDRGKVVESIEGALAASAAFFDVAGAGGDRPKRRPRA